jgi:lipoate-protein ligase A
VALGYFQAIKEEVNIEACERDGVEIFRRLTGGGAVYKDPAGELNYSLVIPESHPKVPQDILASYRVIQQGIIQGLSLLGLKAELNGVNDIVVNGKKISGNAQTRKNGVLFQHGTILLDFDVEKMVTYLNISQEKISDKGLKNIRDRVGTLREYLPDASLVDIENAIIKGFEKTFDIKTVPGELTDQENYDKEKLYKQKYSGREWNYWR